MFLIVFGTACTMLSVALIWFFGMISFKFIGNDIDFAKELKTGIEGLNKDLGWSLRVPGEQ